MNEKETQVELVFSKQPKFMQAITDSLLMIKRSSTHIIRNTDQLLGTFFQPIMFLVLFTAVFNAVGLALPKDISYLDFLMAGIIVQTVAFGSTTTSIAVANDLQRGIVDRFKSLPMSNVAVLNGHVISDVFRNGISTTVMLLTGLLFGFRPDASISDWMLIIGILVLFTLAFSWLSAIMGVLAKSVEGVQWMSFLIVFPLTFASGAFAPTDSLAEWIRPFAENQPITHVIEAVRGLMIGTPIDDHGWLAIVWSLAILVVSIPVATWLFKKKTIKV
ncbi:TPA: multidrug ABC transporter permease [Candidatus Saccharibacteria bacterium]|nr:multidrug ABC transporter permease [Candidatus Saccharibacteria bacterium]HRJ90609.1 ABC transporter permease [Candidatus Saccharibacteria bacterium]